MPAGFPVAVVVESNQIISLATRIPCCCCFRIRTLPLSPEPA